MAQLLRRRQMLLGMLGVGTVSVLARAGIPEVASAKPKPRPTVVATVTATPTMTPAPSLTPTVAAPTMTPAPSLTPTVAAPTMTPAPTQPSAPAGFVRASGRALTRDGAAFKLKGASTYRGGAWGGANERGRIDADLNRAQAANLNTIRLVDYLQGSGGPAGYVGDVYAAQIYANIDYLLTGAAARGMFVIFDLSTFRNRLERAGKMPYNLADWTAYLDFIGGRYKNAKSIAYFALAGEPAPPNGSDPLRPTTAGLTSFFVQARARLQSADPNHLVSCGGLLQLNWNSGIDWRAIFAEQGHANLHVYGSGDAAYGPTVGAWASAAGVPFFLEEFGANQNANTDQQRADYFKARYDLARNQGAAVAAFWDLGPAVGGDTYDVNPNTPLTYAVVRGATL